MYNGLWSSIWTLQIIHKRLKPNTEPSKTCLERMLLFKKAQKTQQNMCEITLNLAYHMFHIELVEIAFGNTWIAFVSYWVGVPWCPIQITIAWGFRHGHGASWICRPRRHPLHPSERSEAGTLRMCPVDYRPKRKGARVPGVSALQNMGK